MDLKGPAWSGEQSGLCYLTKNAWKATILDIKRTIWKDANLFHIDKTVVATVRVTGTRPKVRGWGVRPA